MTNHVAPPSTPSDIIAGIVTAQMAIVSIAHHLGLEDQLKHDLARMRQRAEDDLTILVGGEFQLASKDRYPTLFEALQQNITELSEILDYLQVRKQSKRELANPDWQGKHK